MSVKKHLLLFLIKFAVVYAILLLPPFRSMYADAFIATGKQWFRHIDEKGVTVFKVKENAINPDVIVEITIANKYAVAEALRKKSKNVDNFATIFCNWYAYLIIAYLVALILATPISWKRKLFSLLAGLTLTYFYFLLMIWVLLLYKFNQNTQLDVLQLSGFKKTLVDVLYPVLVGNPGTTVFAALFIYVLVVFRKQDLEKLKTIFRKEILAH